MGWRDRPFATCEFGNIIAPNHLYIDSEGAFLDNFPQRLGTDGVQNLTIQFESYANQFWGDMQMMIDLVNITQPGTLELYIPDASMPLTTVAINAGDTVCYFNPGGILAPGPHTMTLSAVGGLSMGMDGMIFTSVVPIPDLPTVITNPFTNITANSAMGGGIVTADGGAPVTARGVCWSTLPNPTILDSHTTDGAGLGPFTSFIAPLIPNTVYHGRAYATNLTGTAYGQEMVFITLPPEQIITGTVRDSLDINVPWENLYIIAYNPCNPSDSLTTFNGGITLAPGGQYTVHCNNFINPPTAGQPVIMSFFDIFTECFAPETVVLSPAPVTYFNPVVRIARHVHLPYKTSYVRVVIPPHKTLQIHYTYVNGCGNTDVFEWNGLRWTKFRQWNWNHYCTWRYIQNNSNKPKIYVIHNDNGNIRFDMMFNCPFNPPTSPSNYNEFALFNMGWRDRPFTSCEFGNIVAVNHTFIDYEGAFLDNFPQVIGSGGVQNLTIQFESYANQFWGDMQMMVELSNVTQQGTLQLHIPDATNPFTTAMINAGDTVCYFNPGGILAPGTHTMILSATGGLSVGLEGLIYTTLMPVPEVPAVITLPVTNLAATSATSGGNVTFDGGAFVNNRGVCWSTSPNPTILDNHTMDGTGLGIYISLMTGLTPGTTYHVRAYATNLAGTGYGEDIMFTTLILVPPVEIVQNIVVNPGQTVCYNATQTIWVAGGGTHFYVMPGGSATFIAGHNIIYQPYTMAFAGSYMHGYITTSNQYCPGQSPSMVSVVTGVEPIPFISTHAFFNIYPNPTNGNFILEQKGEILYANLQVEVYSMRGERIMTAEMTGEKKHEFQFAEIPAGLYFVKVISNDKVETIKLIKAH